MEITEVRIKLMEDAQERLQAFCSITFDHCFVIRDLKIIEGTRGSFVAMPSRKLTDRCPRCGTKNHLRASFCNQCGVHLRDDRAGKDGEGRSRLYADIAHPINARCREQIQARVMQAFAEEQIRACQPGYVCTYDDFGEESFAVLEEAESLASAGSGGVSGANENGERRVDLAPIEHEAPLSGPHFPLGAAMSGTGEFSRERVPWLVGERCSPDEGFGVGVM